MTTGLTTAELAEINGLQTGSTMTSATKESTIAITDIISEGPISGLVEGTSSVFLNNTPMKGANLRAYKPVQNTSASATAGTITFSGTTGTIVGATLPSDLTSSSSEAYTRHLVITDLHTFTFTKSSEINFSNRSSAQQNIPMAERTKVELFKRTGFPTTAITAQNSDMNAVLTHNNGNRVYGEFSLKGNNKRGVFEAQCGIIGVLDESTTDSNVAPLEMRVQKSCLLYTSPSPRDRG